MQKSLHDFLVKVAKLINIVLMTYPVWLTWVGYYINQMESRFYIKGELVVIAVFIFIYFLFTKVYDAFLVSFTSIGEIVYSQCLSALLADAVMYFVFILLTRGLPNPLPLVVALATQIVISFVWTFIANKLYFKRVKPLPTAVIYDIRRDTENLIKADKLDRKYDVQLIESVSECIDSNLESLKDKKVVFLSGIHSHERNIIIKYCVANDIEVYVIPRIGDVIMESARQMHMLHLPIMQVRRYAPPLEFTLPKRIFDIFSASALFIVVSPFLLITAIAIKAYDGGPVLYKQVRLTKDGREFKVLKFRSMRTDAEKDGVARLSTGDNDDRITPIGKIIRKVRIDELPQLINIIKGDMSVVGPRPERPEIAAQYEEELPEFRLRLQAKAGLTGYAQVYGKYNTTPYDKLQMDLMYIAHPSVLEDLRIIFATIKILFMSDSTEGVSEGQETAMGDNK